MEWGFTLRQARFLTHVLVFSGVFLERQYCAFAGIAHGQKTHDFLGEARRRRVRPGDHARRAAPRPAVPRAVQAAVRGHWRTEQPKPEARLTRSIRRAADAPGRRPRRLALRLARDRARQDELLRRIAGERSAEGLVSPSHVRRGPRKDHPVLSRQAPDRHASRWRPATRVPLPGHPRRACRVSAVSPAPCGPAQGRRRMDDPPPRPAPISEGGGTLSLCRPGCVRARR